MEDPYHPNQSVYNFLPDALAAHTSRYSHGSTSSDSSDSDIVSVIEREQDDIERLDSVYARALQLRELRARNFDDNNMDLALEPEWPEFLDQILMLDMMDPSDSEDPDDPSPPDIPTYPVGPQVQSVECAICCVFDNMTLRPCCQLAVCSDCLSQYLATQVNQANVRIECLSLECSSYIHRDEVLAKLEPSTKEKYYKFLVDANQDPHIKTCPRCSHVMKLSEENTKSLKSASKGLKVSCEDCSLVWCFPCQAPWHEGILCKEFRKGDKLLRAWAKELRAGQHNAQRCPRCKIYIQRAAGCDHMICSRCKTNFCYRCGERFRHIKFIGDHYSRLSVFGCRYRFLPDRPVKRKLIRGAILGGKLLVAPVVAGLAVGGAALFLGFGTIAAPFYGGYKLHKRLKLRKQRERRRRMEQEQRFPRNVYLFPEQHTLFPDYMTADDLDVVIRRGILARNGSMQRFLSATNDLPPVHLPVSRFSENVMHRRDLTAETALNGVLPTVSARVDEKEVNVEVLPSDGNPTPGNSRGEVLNKRAVTTARIMRPNPAGEADLEYTMEVLNVVTRYIDDKSDEEDTDTKHSYSSWRKDDTANIKGAIQLTKNKPDNTIESSVDQIPTTKIQSGEATMSAKGKSICRKIEKVQFAKELEKTTLEAEVLTNNNILSVKNSAKEGEGKGIAHVPWLNIVCGKMSKEKELPPKKTSLAEKCPIKSTKDVDGKSEGKNEMQDELDLCLNVSPLSTSETVNLDVKQKSLKPASDCKSYDLGAFGPESDDGDDFSVSSASECPPQPSSTSYFNAAGHCLEFIDEEYVSQQSEITCL